MEKKTRLQIEHCAKDARQPKKRMYGGWTQQTAAMCALFLCLVSAPSSSWAKKFCVYALGQTKVKANLYEFRGRDDSAYGWRAIAFTVFTGMGAKIRNGEEVVLHTSATGTHELIAGTRSNEYTYTSAKAAAIYLGACPASAEVAFSDLGETEFVNNSATLDKMPQTRGAQRIVCNTRYRNSPANQRITLPGENKLIFERPYSASIPEIFDEPFSSSVRIQGTVEASCTTTDEPEEEGLGVLVNLPKLSQICLNRAFVS